MNAHTRREFLRRSGTVAVGAIGLGSSLPAVAAQTEWTAVESPTTKTLNGVVATTEGPFAVGAGGDVLARRADGWQKVVEYGPQARSRRLTGVDVTDDGEAIWFVGGSGVIGEYDVVTETLTNYSAPRGITSTWEDCAIQGETGTDERLYFANGSGELLVGDRQDSGAVQYRDLTKPGGGSTIPGIDFHDRQHGHCCSTSQFVAETSDGGQEWTQIGIGFSGSSFFDAASVGPRDVNVAAGSGVVYRYDGFRWTPHVIDGDRQSVRAVARDGEAGLAGGDAGKVYERQSAGQWRRTVTDVEGAFHDVAVGANGVDVAVGAGGTIVERVQTDGDDTGTPTEGNQNGTATPTGGGENGTATAAGGDATGTAAETTNALEGALDDVAAAVDVPAGSKDVRRYREGTWLP